MPVIAILVGALDWLLLVAIGWSGKGADCGFAGLTYVPVLAIIGFVTTPFEIWAFGVGPLLVGLFAISRAVRGPGSPLAGSRGIYLGTAIVAVWVAMGADLSHKGALSDLDVGGPPFAAGVFGNAVLTRTFPSAQRFQWLVPALLAVVVAIAWGEYAAHPSGHRCFG